MFTKHSNLWFRWHLKQPEYPLWSYCVYVTVQGFLTESPEFPVSDITMQGITHVKSHNIRIHHNFSATMSLPTCAVPTHDRVAVWTQPSDKTVCAYVIVICWKILLLLQHGNFSTKPTLVWEQLLLPCLLLSGSRSTHCIHSLCESKQRACYLTTLSKPVLLTTTCTVVIRSTEAKSSG